MSKKKKTKQVNGKGDRNRVLNKKRFDKNWEKIFRPKGKEFFEDTGHEQKK